MKKILVTPRSFVSMEAMAREKLAPYGVELVINRTGKSYSADEMKEILPDIDGVIVGVDPLDAEVLACAPKLKAISKYGAGLDNVDLGYCEQHGIKVMRAAGANSHSVAELAIALMFSTARFVDYSTRGSRQGLMQRKQGGELAGKMLGLIGLGAIGWDVAQMAMGIGMAVMATDPYADPEKVHQAGIVLTDRDTIIEECDFISLHLPLTEETEGMVNAEFLAHMKDTAILINTARGGLVDEDALYEALKHGLIAGAASDVFSSEPPEKDNKLVALDNFILTAHIGAFTREAVLRTAKLSVENLIEMLFA